MDEGSSVAANGILIDDSNGGSAVAATSILNEGFIHGSNGFAVRIVGDFNDVITNTGSGAIISEGTSATIDMGGGNDTLLNRGFIINNFTGSGQAVDLGAGDDQMTIISGAVLGNISGGTGTDSLAINPGSAGFEYGGVLADFENVEVQSGNVLFTGMSTYSGQTLVSGGALELRGANRLSSASHLALGDGALRLLNVDGPDGQAFAGLSVLGDASLDLGLSSITFELLESVAAGSSLSIFGWSSVTSPDYAIRFAGDLSASTMFLALIDAATVNGLQAAFFFDGLYTNVSAPVPLPGALWLMASGLGILAAARRRKDASRDSHPAVIHA